jgi:thiamine-phosphate pyrophosphorylase
VILHLVTDRRRLLVAGTEEARRACLLEQIRRAIDAGVDAVQIREPDLEAGALAALVGDCVAAARGSATRVLVNERVDVALAAGADGVHLRADSVPADRLRVCLPPGFIVGRSVHGVDEARRAAPHVSYLIAGTVWPTASKPRVVPLLGTDGLTRIATAVAVAVLAIGGVTVGRGTAVKGAGAAGVAGISLFMGDPDGCRAAPLAEVVRALKAL